MMAIPASGIMICSIVQMVQTVWEAKIVVWQGMDMTQEKKWHKKYDIAMYSIMWIRKTLEGMFIVAQKMLYLFFIYLALSIIN